MSNIKTLIGKGLAANKPATPFEGWLYFETDTGLQVRYSGSAWETVSSGGGGGGSPPDDFDLLTDGVDSLIFADGDVIWIL